MTNLTSRSNLTSLGMIIFLVLALAACQSYQHAAFSRRDVGHAQKLIGLSFSKPAIDTMYRYLGNNLDGYDTMRTFKLDYNTAPALYFDPRPDGFIIPREQQPISWNLPEQCTLPENPENLAFYSVAELGVLIKTRQISSEALTRFFLDRLKRFNPTLKAVVTLTDSLALEQAGRADREIAAGLYKGPLHGIPFGVKDLMSLKGYPTTWGAQPYRNQVIDQTATVLEKLEQAGAVLVGKLTSGELARGDIWFGGQTRNPWDTLQGASGSSAGSASAVAAGLVPFAIGTETLGSIVAPSARCGATGLRPTYGRVSRFGTMTLSWSMDKIGPICRSALDCALVFDAIRGEDGKDRTVQDAPFNFDASRPAGSLKVGFLKTEFDKDTSLVGKNNLQALSVFREMGIELKPVELPAKVPYAVFDIILRAESGAFFDALVRSGEVDQLTSQDRGSRANSLRQSRFIPAVEYLQANRHRKELIEAMHPVFKDLDVLIAPDGRQNLVTNLTGHPAIALPTGFDNKGRPTSITLLGNLYDEASILTLALQFQQRTIWEEQHPPVFSSKAEKN